MAGSGRTPRLSPEIRAAAARVMTDDRSRVNLAFSPPSRGEVSALAASGEPAIRQRTPRILRQLPEAALIADFPWSPFKPWVLQSRPTASRMCLVKGSVTCRYPDIEISEIVQLPSSFLPATKVIRY